MKESADPFDNNEPQVLSRLLELGLKKFTAEANRGDWTSSERIERTVAGHELFRELGRGGSGVVYLARQISVNRLVAFKILAGHQFGDQRALLRFQREAELVASLQHSRIVRIYEFGIHEGVPFYSMQWVEGSNLRERLLAGDLSWQQAVRWAVSIAETVHFAHQHGVIHRDLKPENVLIDLDDQLHLTDFGLARRIEDLQGMTITQAVAGTPHYIAPEVLTSFGRDLSAAADQYAVGAILYEVLTGRSPFLGESLGEIAENIRRRNPVPPSHIRSAIPRQLDAICLKALRKRPHQRYADTQELAEALKCTLAAGSRSGGRGKTRASHHRVVAWAGLGIFGLIMVCFIGDWISLKTNPPRQTTASQEPLLSASPIPAKGATGQLSPTSHPVTKLRGPAEVWTNTLGMKFVATETDLILFSIWDVRVSDFKAFVDTTGYDAVGEMVSLKSDGWKPRGDTWKNPGFPQTDDCPVVGVSWNDAHAFCKWLTTKERAEGKLGPNQSYRLPTDDEWSKAVGLSEDSSGTPEDKSGKVSNVFPWGPQWPPPYGAGNYDGEDFDALKGIRGYRDGFANTSPVGTFSANKYGLYDMGGNVWQWCEDKYSPADDKRVLRGASWDPYGSFLLLSSYRHRHPPSYRGGGTGFRVVLVNSP